MSVRTKPPFDHTGSTFDSFLKQEGIIDKVDATAMKRLANGKVTHSKQKPDSDKKPGASLNQD
jgi:hypothetical protein